MDLKMRNTLKEATWKRYRKAPKAIKTKILDELCALTGYHRQYAIAQLNRMEDREPRLPQQRRVRKRRYTPDVLAVIEKVWEEAGYPWSVRLKSILKLWMPWIRRRYDLTSLQETKMLAIGARTIDRYLASKKRDLRKRLYGRTKPGTLLRHKIPIKCESWNETVAGHLELMRLYMNLFQPSVKLRKRVRKGSRKIRRYDEPLTALDRLLQLPDVDHQKLDPLVHLRNQLDPFALSAVIRRKLDRLWELRAKRKVVSPASSPSEERAEAKEIAKSLARRMHTPENKLGAQNAVLYSKVFRWLDRGPVHGPGTASPARFLRPLFQNASERAQRAAKDSTPSTFLQTEVLVRPRD